VLSVVAMRVTADCLNAWVKLRRFFRGALVLLGEQCVSGSLQTLGRERFREPLWGRNWCCYQFAGCFMRTTENRARSTAIAFHRLASVRLMLRRLCKAARTLRTGS